MEKEKLIQCVPGEMLERLKALLDRLWDEKNPLAVHLSVIMDEFDAEIKSLAGTVKEYEADYAGRLEFMKRRYEDHILALKNELADFKARSASFDRAVSEGSKKAAELGAALRAKEFELAESRAKAAETETLLNSKYAARMQELYEKIGKKEMETVSRWEEKNRALEEREEALENQLAGREREFKSREKALQDDFNARKAELIKTFDRVRLDFEAREKNLAAREGK